MSDFFTDDKFQFGNVVFNWESQQPMLHISCFAEGYHRCAKVLVQQFIEQAKSGYGDSDAYPIFFLYRHALELRLKSIIYWGARLFDLLEEPSLNKKGFLSNHGLMRLLPSLKEIMKILNWKWEPNDPRVQNWSDFETIVQEIENIDPASYCFRYPTNTKGTSDLPHHLIMNPFVFADKLDPVLDALDSFEWGVGHYVDQGEDAKQMIRDLFR